MTRGRLRVSMVSCVLAAAAFTQSACPPQGLTLVANGGRLGDVWSIGLTGSPNAPGVLAFDATAGPTATPIGTVCLGLTPAFGLLPFALDGSGLTTIGGVLPADPTLAGIAVFLQGAASDGSQPSGFALSNGASVTLHQPRLFFINLGFISPFGSTPGSFAALSTLTDTVPFSQALTTSVRDATFVRELNWLLLLQGDNRLAAYHGVTGAQTLSVILPTIPTQPSKVLSAPGGDRVLLLASGIPPSPFGGGSPGGLQILSLPTGTFITTVPLASGNPDAMMLVPDLGVVFLRLPTSLVAIDYVTGFAFPPILLPTGFGSIIDWQLSGNVIYCLHGGAAPGLFTPGTPAALTAVSANSQTVLLSTPLTAAPPLTMLRAGPGTTGPSLYTYGTNAAALGEFSQGSLTPTLTIPTGAGITAMELSSLGSEWLLFCNGAVCGGLALLRMPASTAAISTVSALPPGFQTTISVSPSAVLGKAYLVAGNNLAVPVYTDPAAPPASTVTLPITSAAFRVVSN